jgi:hypothetical protein
MNLNEVLQPPEEYEIYCDLDGVLVDFDELACKISGKPRSNDTEMEEKYWDVIIAYSQAGNKFYGAMNLMLDAMQLWNHIKKHGAKILSSTGRRGHKLNARKEKIDWVKENLGAKASREALFVEDTPLKAKYAKPNRILIDDRKKAIDAWVKAGGIGILHKTAARTIQELKKYGL